MLQRQLVNEALSTSGTFFVDNHVVHFSWLVAITDIRGNQMRHEICTS